jgi:hypothetical protein
MEIDPNNKPSPWRSGLIPAGLKTDYLTERRKAIPLPMYGLEHMVMKVEGAR